MADWERYVTEAGRVYFHNTRTDETTWDEPEELVAHRTAREERLAANQRMEPPPPQQAEEYDPFLSSESDDDGVLAASSKGGDSFGADLQIQESVRRAQAHIKAALRSKSSASTDDVARLGAQVGLDARAEIAGDFVAPQATSHESRPVSADQVENLDPTARRQLFLEMLEERVKTSRGTFEVLTRDARNDPRMAGISSERERRKLFSERLSAIRAEERMRRDEVESRLRASFRSMIEESPVKTGIENAVQAALAGQPVRATEPTSFRRACAYFEGDVRFAAVQQLDAEKWYYEALAEVAEERFKAFSRDLDELRAKLAEAFRAPDFAGFLTYSSACATLDEQIDEALERTSGAECALVPGLDAPTARLLDGASPLLRLEAWEAHIRGMEKDEDHEWERSELRWNTACRRVRDDFRDAIRGTIENVCAADVAGRVLTPTKLSWQDDILPLAKPLPQYARMLHPSQSGSLPCEVFAGVVEEFEAEQGQNVSPGDAENAKLPSFPPSMTDRRRARERSDYENVAPREKRHRAR